MIAKENNVQFSGYMKNVLTSKIVSAIILIPLERVTALTYVMGNTHPPELVLIVVWVHLFPSRTQKLSTRTPTIVAGRLAVKIGNANTNIPL